MEQGKRVVNVIESGIQIFDCKVFSDVVFLELIPLMKFSVLGSPCFPMTACLNSLSFKTEYGKKCCKAYSANESSHA